MKCSYNENWVVMMPTFLSLGAQEVGIMTIFCVSIGKKNWESWLL